MEYMFEKGMISVIIPVYNASAFIRQCLDSLLRQTYKNWQAILIDDGSIDSSYSICQEYSKGDDRFQVISKKMKEFLKLEILHWIYVKGNSCFSWMQMIFYWMRTVLIS